MGLYCDLKPIGYDVAEVRFVDFGGAPRQWRPHLCAMRPAYTRACLLPLRPDLPLEDPVAANERLDRVYSYGGATSPLS
jgi:hypothetical protein